MCIRYEKETGRLIKWSHKIRAWIALEDWDAGLDTFPGYVAPVVFPDWDRGLAFAQGQWGMTPAWAKDPAFGKRSAYNARAETLLEKPTFRTAFRKRRCVVPATSFFERSGGNWIRFAAVDEVLPLAGLYEPPNDYCELPSFALVTTEPNDQVREIQDRMPVVLAPDDVARWLDPKADLNELRALMLPCPSSWTTIEDAGPIRQPKKSYAPSSAPSLFDDF